MKIEKIILFIVLFCFVFVIGALVGGDYVIKQQEIYTTDDGYIVNILGQEHIYYQEEIMAKYRKTLNEKILLYRIDVYCATMADFWSEKDDPMYFESKQGIYTIAGLMQDFMGENYNNIVKYAIKKLNGYLALQGEED